MGKQSLRTTIVTIKGMPVDAWETAKSAALRSGETLGEWTARAIRQLADRERGERVFPPGQASQTEDLADSSNSVSPPPSGPTAAELAELMQAVAAMAAATGVAVPARTARGFYMAASRASRGKLVSRSGQTSLQIQGPEVRPE
jgi:hypothetical protein